MSDTAEGAPPIPDLPDFSRATPSAEDNTDGGHPSPSLDIDAVIAAHEGTRTPTSEPEPQSTPAEAQGADQDPPSPLPAEEPPAEPPPRPAGDATELARLMAEERALRERTEQRSRETETRAQALDRREQELRALEQSLQPVRQLQQTIEQRDLGALMEHYGLNREQFLDLVDNGGGADPARALRGEFQKQLEEATAPILRELEERRNADRERDTQEARAEIGRGFEQHSPLLASVAKVRPEVYEGTMEALRAHYRQHGQVPGLDTVIPGLQEAAENEAFELAEATLPFMSEERKERLRALLAPAGEEPAKVKESAPKKPPVSVSNADMAERTRVSAPTKDQAPAGNPGDLDSLIDQTLAAHGYA